jgi:HEXXH motif-containing protein
VNETELSQVLAAPDAGVTEGLLRHSARNRFEDLIAIRDIVVLVDGLEPWARGFEALCRDIEATGVETDPRLRSPVLRGWLNRFGLIEDWTGADPRLIDQLNDVDNMRLSPLDAGDWEGVFAVRSGVCMGWDCRLGLALGDTIGGASEVRLEKDGHRLRWETEEGATGGLDLDEADDPRILTAPTLPGSQIVVRNDLPLLRLRLRENDTPSREGGVVAGAFDERESAYGAFDAAEFVEAGRLVAAAWPQEYADWRATLRVIVPRGAPRGWEVHGMTVSSHQGACWVVARGFPDVVDTLIHEQSHIKLRYLEEAVPILEPRQTQETFLVGWRSDPRPIVGIYEGVYVNLHVIEALTRMLDQGLLTGARADLAVERAGVLQAKVTEALDILGRHARFTEAGTGFMAWAVAAADRYARILPIPAMARG